MCDLDEAGFGMTLPVCHSWFPVGECLRVPYEAPQGRRVNAIGAHFSHGPQAGRFEYQTWANLPRGRSAAPQKALQETALQETALQEKALAQGLCAEEVGAIDAGRLVAFIWRIAGRPTDAPQDWRRELPLYVWMDNYSVHKSQPVREALPLLEAADVHLKYLPSYSPQMSSIEPVWNDAKRHHMPVRSFSDAAAAKASVDAGLCSKAQALRQAHDKCANLGPAPT